MNQEEEIEVKESMETTEVSEIGKRSFIILWTLLWLSFVLLLCVIFWSPKYLSLLMLWIIGGIFYGLV